METVEIQVPEELLMLLKRTKLGDRKVDDQVRAALAIHLFQEGLVSVGKAASIAGEPRGTFELLLAEMGIPSLRYDLEDYKQDLESYERVRLTVEDSVECNTSCRNKISALAAAQQRQPLR